MVDYSSKTIVWCRKLGWPAESVYKPWNPYSRKTVDFIGGIDVLAYDRKPGILGIQATGKHGNAAAHVRKLREVVSSWPDFLSIKRGQTHGRDWEQVPEEHPLLLHLEAGNRLQIWAWRLVAVKRGGKQKVWRPRVLSFSVESLCYHDVEPEELDPPMPPPRRAPSAKASSESDAG